MSIYARLRPSSFAVAGVVCVSGAVVDCAVFLLEHELRKKIPENARILIEIFFIR